MPTRSAARRPTRTSRRYYIETAWRYTCDLGIPSHLRFVIDVDANKMIAPGYRSLGAKTWRRIPAGHWREITGQIVELWDNVERFRQAQPPKYSDVHVSPTKFSDRLPKWAERPRE